MTRTFGFMALEGKSVIAIYEALSLADVQSAADVFQAVYDKTGGRDGYVSLEVNPHSCARYHGHD